MKSDVSPLSARHFSSLGAPENERFDMWRDTVQQIHDLQLPAGASQADFRAEVAAWSLGPLAVAGGFFTARRMLRGDRITRRLQIDHYRILLPLGDTVVRHAAKDQRHILRRGQMVFSDLSRAEEADCGTGELIQFIIARDTLDAVMPKGHDLHGYVPEGALASLVTEHLTALVRRLPDLTSDDAGPLAQATLHMIAAVAGATPIVSERPGRAMDFARRQRILRHIDAHLLEPDLGQETLSARFGLSRASLYRLFQPLGGVAACIQERKLRRLQAELAGPGPHHLGAMAWKYGFSSQGQMSRAFRAMFGHAPRDTEPGEAPALRARPDGAGLSFGEILRQLQ